MKQFFTANYTRFDADRSAGDGLLDRRFFLKAGALGSAALLSATAYVVYMNEIVERNQKIDADSLPQVKMPNRDNFRWAVEGGH